ncbi:675_t:CDS:2 [Entrophospora sp. SA101]|nr:14436_t:CDS:2 [Entrophospora sp. SA101]CAJ0913494.1 675_t:CDS:2 [Entrophospora sp. SA101]
MTRATETAIVFSIITLVYLLFFLEIITLPEIIQHEILPVEIQLAKDELRPKGEIILKWHISVN